MWTGEQAPPPGAASKSSILPSAVSPSAKPENPLGFQPSCHPYQFLLKSFRFPGAKTARKRFLLWKMGFSAAKILPCPPYMPLGTIEIREGFGPLELSKGFSTVWAGERRLLRFFRGERSEATDGMGERNCMICTKNGGIFCDIGSTMPNIDENACTRHNLVI